VEVPAHEPLLVPQSFWPALTMPAHFSVWTFCASALVLAAARPRASRLAMAPWMRCWCAFM
jgi:hypothetical protein